MNKQLSAVMISLSLGIWLVAVCNFSGQPNFQVKQTSISVLSDLSSLPDLQFFELGNHPEVPGFKVDWSLSGKLNSEIESFGSLSEIGCLTNSFFKKLVTLFDVKITFLHFFYPW
ncbi:hypothetical protein [Algoriphagus antarcticus]|uniref:Uncharacterized protein n=1 Tax=Algoriphagus antarcticus TaxID=238540 RepID=A0A3E0E7G7_9BACT|nr:hypothetical protein [Algoriphagus antarcticus]REG94214.1 hypothetical protein C8N25_10139 [Algoriphagus antarcticus]